MKNKFYEFISKVEFEEAKKIFDDFSDSEKEEVIRSLAFEADDMLIYLFVEYVNNKEERVLYHELAFDILAHVLCFVEGAYQMAFFHNKKLVMLQPDSIKYREWMLSFYDIKVINKEDTKRVARDILKRDKNNKLANEMLQRLE